jgi:hypothetical protein
MNMSVQPRDQDQDAFPSTHWSTVCVAGGAQLEARLEALERLLERYRGPLIAHLRWRFHAEDDQAEDWLHGFVEKRILEKELLLRADREKGRFRTFLLTALDHFVQDDLRRRTRSTRSPQGGLVSLEELETQSMAVPGPDPGDPFEPLWIRTVLAQTTERLRSFYLTKGRSDLWGLFEAGLLEPILDDTEAPSLDEMARRFHFRSARQASNGLITAKRMFRRILALVVAEYVADSSLVSEEIRELVDKLEQS